MSCMLPVLMEAIRFVGTSYNMAIPPFTVAPTPDASSTKKGKVQLTNDLGGTAASPTVVNLHLSGDTAINHKLTDVSDPTNAQDAATKTYVDNAASGAGLSNKGASRLATVAALPTNIYSNGASGVGATLVAVATGVLTIDGAAVATNNLIVVKDEVAQANNGIYKCTTAGAIGVAYILTRATNMDQATEIGQAYSFVTAGTTNQNTSWNVNAGTYVVGTTAIVWNQFSASPILIGGSAIDVTGNIIDLEVDNVTLEVAADAVQIKALGVTGTQLENIVSGATVGSSTQVPVITYDNKGRITSTTTASLSTGTQRSFAFFAP